MMVCQLCNEWRNSTRFVSSLGKLACGACSPLPAPAKLRKGETYPRARFVACSADHAHVDNCSGCAPRWCVVAACQTCRDFDGAEYRLDERHGKTVATYGTCLSCGARYDVTSAPSATEVVA